MQLKTFAIPFDIQKEIKKHEMAISKSNLPKLQDFINNAKYRDEFNYLRHVVDDFVFREDLLMGDTRKNRYNDIKPCKYNLITY
mgnify:CR=1 FL=1